LNDVWSKCPISSIYFVYMQCCYFYKYFQKRR
jgi:hypothetical protein